MRYSFGSCVLDADRFELTVGGEVVPLEPRVFDMLAYLLSQRGRVVSREELLAQVWKGDHVTHTVVNKNVFLGRQAIGQGKAAGPIETVRGRGYRFSAAAVQVHHSGNVQPGTAAAASQAAPAEAGELPLEPFVGRRRELSLLKGLLANAQRGEGRACVLTGATGLGKTRLADELATDARRSGCHVLRGRRPRDRGAPPMWPWVQAIRQSAQQYGRDRLREALGPAARELATLWPPIDDSVPAPSALPPVGEIDGATRTRLFDALGQWLGVLADFGCHVLVLDDLGGPGDSSAAAVDFLADELVGLPLLLVATTRAEAGLVSGQRISPLVHIPLSPLSSAEVETYTEAVLGFAAPQLAALVSERSEGLPFIMSELLESYRYRELRGLDEMRELATSPSIAAPTDAMGLVRGLLAGVPDACLQLLRVAAVVGREFELRWLIAVARVEADECVEALQDAIEARLVERGEAGRFIFTHGLVVDTLYADLTIAERRRLHMAVADALELDVRAGREADVHTLVHHLSEALPHDRVEVLVDYATRAAQASTRMSAYREAADAYGAAAAALRHLDSGEVGGRRIELWMAQAASLHEAGELSGARAAYRAAFEMARVHRLPMEMARGAIGLRSAQLWRAVPETEAGALLDEALQALPPHAHGMRARLLSHMAGVRAMAPRRAMAQRAAALLSEMSDDAVGQEAAASSMSIVRADVLRAQLHATQGPGELPRRLELADQLAQLGAAEGRPSWTWHAEAVRHETCVRLADVAAAAAALAECARLADQQRNPQLQWEVQRYTLHGRICGGDITEVTTSMAALASSGARLQIPFASFYFLQQSLWLLRDSGRLGEIAHVYADSTDEFPWVAVTAHSVHALTALELGDQAGVERHYAYYRRQEFHNVVDGEDRVFVAAALTAVAVALDDRLGCERLLAMLSPHSEQITANGSLMHYGAAAHFVGMLHGHLGAQDAALAALERGREINARVGARVPHVRSLLALADHHGRAGNHEPARAMAARASEMALAVGAGALAADAARRLAS